MHYLRYNAGIMAQDITYQLTVRGLDARTKALLTKKAAREGLSVNKLAIQSLRQTAGADSSEERYQHFLALLDKNRIVPEDIRAAEAAIARMDTVSIEKQKKEVARGDFSL